MKRVYRYTLGALMVFVLLMALGAIWLVGTESGLKTSWRLASGFLPEGLAVGVIEGRLAGPLILRNITYNASTFEVSLERVLVDLELRALLARRLHMTELELENVQVTRLAEISADESGTQFSLPDAIELPLAIEFDEAVVDNFAFRTSPEAEPTRVDRLALAGGFTESELRLREIDASGPLFEVAGRVSVIARNLYPADVDLEWTVRRPDVPILTGRTVASGDISRLVVDQSIAAPYNIEAELTLTSLLDDLTLNGTVELGIDMAELSNEFPSAEVDAVISVSGTPAELRIGVGGDVVLPVFESIAVDLQATLRGETVSVEQLRIEHPASTASIASSGSVTLGDAVSANLALRWSDLRWPLDGEAQIVSRAGELSVDGTLDDFRVSIDSVVETGDTQGEIVASGEGSTEGVELSEFQVSALGGEVTGEGRVTLGDAISADLALSWTDLRWPLDGEARVQSQAGSLNVEGTLENYRLAIDADIVTGETRGAIVARGVGSNDAVDLSQLDILALGGELMGTGRLEFDPDLAGSFELVAANINPGILLEEWSGRVGGNIAASGRLAANGPSLAIERLNLTGVLRERDFEFDVRGELFPNAVDLDALSLVSGASSLEAQVMLGENIRADFRVISEDLADFWPGWSGQVSGTGSAVGPRERPRVTLDAAGTNVDLSFARAAQLGIAADIDLAGVEYSDLTMTVSDGAIAETGIDSLALEASGNADGHQLTFDAETSAGHAVLTTTGRIANIWRQDFEWLLDLEGASISPVTLGSWQLREQSRARITAEVQTLERSCWLNEAAEFCLDATSEASGVTAGFDLTELPFGYFAVLSDQLERIEGNFSASGRYQDTVADGLEMTASLSSTEGRLVLEEESEVTLAFGPVAGEIATRAGRFDAELSIPFEGDGDIALLAEVGIDPDDRSFAARPLTVEIDATLAELEIVAKLFPEIGEVAGRLVADIVIQGTVASPEIHGQIELTDGRAGLPQPNLLLEDLQVLVTADGTRPLMLQAAARSGQGVLDVTGQFSLDDRRGTLSIHGENFEAINTADLQAIVSPDLELSFSPDRIDINGDISVPTARITPTEGDDQGVVAVSSDQVIILADAEESDSAFLPPVNAEVGLALGDDVTFEAFGLVGRLTGGISISEVAGEPARAGGQFRIVDGTYTAYGQELEIRTGRLLFVGGPVDRPGLEIEAIRRPVPDVLVGARVRGTLAQPELTLFSEPSMTEQEQLSYLVFGRPLGGGTSSSEQTALAQAALALGLRGGNFVSGMLNERLGFDEFGIQSTPGESAETASFVIGRYLSPSLYVSYGVGLFDSVSTLQLRYRITDRWRVETESSDRESGGDIFWSRERSSYDRTERAPR